MVSTHKHFSFDEIISLPTSDNRVTCGPGERTSTVPKIRCRDGVEISVQAGEGYRCEPQNAQGPWTKVGVGPLAPEFAAELSNYKSPGEYMYNHVPVEVMRRFIAQHGGEVIPTEYGRE